MISINKWLIRLITVLFFLVYFNDIKAQDIESLEKELNEAGISGKERVKLLNHLCQQLAFVDPKRALVDAIEAIKIASQINDDTGLAYAYRNLSSIYSYNESYFMSMEYLQKALDIFSNSNDSIGIGSCYISLGHTYRRLHDRNKEIYYHKKSFEIFTRLKIIDRIGVTAHNLGESYLNNKELDKCRQLTLFAIKINDSINNLQVLSSCYKVMGMLDYQENNLQKAETYFKDVLKISDRLGVNCQKIATEESLIQLAYIYQKRGDTKSQLTFLNKALNFSRKNDLRSQLERVYHQLILYYSDENNQKAVQKYITEYQTVSDSMQIRQNKDRSNLTTNVVRIHDLEKEKNKLEHSSLVQLESIKRRNLILLSVLISTSILALLLFKIFRSNKKITEVNRILKERSDLIEIQKLHLEELNNTKDKFFRIVAHDFKSPLNSLKSFSGILIEQIDMISKEDLIKMGYQLQSSIDNTIKMADGLLTWARLQMKDYETTYEKIFLTEIISDVGELFKKVAEHKGIIFRYSCDSELIVYGDKNQIAFIFRNLVHNAIKFTHKNGSVDLNVKSLSNEEVQVSVCDTGIGISDKLLENIFLIGNDNSVPGTAGEKGTGLGLMLSYEFIKLNNGTIEVESQAGKGTTFSVRLKSIPSNNI